MPQDALAGLAALVGWAEEDLARVTFDGADPTLPTPFRIAAAGAAALAAAGLAAARLWTLRGGASQDIAVDLRQAAASLRSNRYLALDEPKPPETADKLTGFYPTRDERWIYLHCNFPHHRAGIIGLLGAAPDRESVAGATARWEGFALEEALAEAGMPCGIARRAEEWQAHSQAHAIAALPLLEIIRIADSAPEPLPRAERPLAGIRVLDLTRVLAGPTCARTLAEHGAEVLKINSADLPNSGFTEFDTGHGKRSAFLDLGRAGDRATLTGLVQGADVFSQSYRPGALARRGFSPEDLARLRPGIVCTTLSAYGHAGPWRARRGFDSIIQTVSGMALAQSGMREPRLLPVSAIDYISGYLLAFGTMVALARRVAEGGSYLVRASLAQTGRWLAAQGEVPAAAVAAAPSEFDPAEIARWSMHSETPIGRLTHLAPVLRMSETPPRWARPAVPLGHDEAEWEG